MAYSGLPQSYFCRIFYLTTQGPLPHHFENEEVDTEWAQVYLSLRSESENSMKALFIERGHSKVNACDYRKGTLFYRILVSPSPSRPYFFSGSPLLSLITLGAGLLIPDWLDSMV